MTAERSRHLRLVHDDEQASLERVRAAGTERPAHALLAQLLELAPGVVWTGTHDDLARGLDLSVKTVGRWSAELEKLGLLSVRKRPGQGSTYIVERDVRGPATSDMTSDIVSEVRPSTPSSSSSSATSDIQSQPGSRETGDVRRAQTRDITPDMTADIRGGGDLPTGALTMAGRVKRAGFEPEPELVAELLKLPEKAAEFALDVGARRAGEVWREERRRLPSSYLLEVVLSELRPRLL